MKVRILNDGQEYLKSLGLEGVGYSYHCLAIGSIAKATGGESFVTGNLEFEGVDADGESCVQLVPSACYEILED